MLHALVKRALGPFVVAVAIAACGPSPILVARPVDATVPTDVVPVDAGPMQLVAADEAGDANAAVPVSSLDPQWGDSNAPVTIVEFSDLQCPFCKKASFTIHELQRIYGPQRLRVVWKNYPLEFHVQAKPAAERAMAIFERGGDKAFWSFVDSIFDGDRLDESSLRAAVERAGVSQGEIEAIVSRGHVQKKLDEDLELVHKLDVTGTPAFFVNGRKLSGAQPLEDFRTIVDAELAETIKLASSGVTSGFYAKRVAENFAKPEPKPDVPAAPVEDTKTVWNVPVGGSPVRGNKNALVTIVEFSDFQCPFCQRAQATLNQVASTYGAKVRLVYKAEPLTFHPRAEPAAELAFEVRAKKGEAAFWRVYDVLYASPMRLEDADLRAAAKSEGIDPDAAMRAVTAHKHKDKIEDDADLADSVSATGTPTFFVNGRKLVGAQPFDKFQAMVDEELAKAEALVQQGIRADKVYEHVIAKGKTTDGTPDRVSLPLPTKDNPSRGPANAKVTIQVFGDFQCPFCAREQPVLADLDKAFPGKLRWVWRNKPLPFHPNAAPAAEAAMEIFKQKGSAAFWSMHDLLYANQANLDRATLEAHAKKLGANLARFDAALDTEAHKAQIDADLKVADDAKISGTPTFVVNDILIVGAQPLAKLRRAVQKAIAERK